MTSFVEGFLQSDILHSKVLSLVTLAKVRKLEMNMILEVESGHNEYVNLHGKIKILYVLKSSTRLY